jgi:hypothetical protein
LFAVAWRRVLEVEGQRAIGIVFQLIARADDKLVQRVGDEPPAIVNLVHGRDVLPQEARVGCLSPGRAFARQSVRAIRSDIDRSAAAVPL